MHRNLPWAQGVADSNPAGWAGSDAEVFEEGFETGSLLPEVAGNCGGAPELCQFVQEGPDPLDIELGALQLGPGLRCVYLAVGLRVGIHFLALLDQCVYPIDQ